MHFVYQNLFEIFGYLKVVSFWSHFVYQNLFYIFVLFESGQFLVTLF